MPAPLLLPGYLAAVFGATLIHDPAWLAGGLATALLLAGRARWQLLRRAVVALLLFNLAVSLGYALHAHWQGLPYAEALLAINLRVLLCVYLGFWLVSRLNLLDALAGWPTLRLIATLAIGQIGVYRRLLDDYRLAFRSRHAAPPAMSALLRHAGAQAGGLADKSLHAAEDVAQAMRSRGVFDV